eukprot:TRINITY_DN6554_c0_g2_i1.p1 TRINITY_DN6554_c0_g2~~TRINITY_DN6554_c0_g2_i1.p1  ORF type:complete len:147 (-),score=7.89 TRINITY_DN6554_c0_g2_i1:29-412(-)
MCIRDRNMSQAYTNFKQQIAKFRDEVLSAALINASFLSKNSSSLACARPPSSFLKLSVLPKLSELFLMASTTFSHATAYDDYSDKATRQNVQLHPNASYSLLAQSRTIRPIILRSSGNLLLYDRLFR